MPPDLFSSREQTPPFVRPFLDALDRMHEHEERTPDALLCRAEALLAEQFGTSSHPTETAFAHGAISLLGDHTHYSNGFALLMPVRQGTAVAIRRAEGTSSRLVFEGEASTWSLGRGPADAPAWVHVVEQGVAEFAGPEASVEVAVVSTLPAVCFDAYLAALAVATARAVFAHTGRCTASEQEEALEPHLPALRRVLAESTGLPFSVAFPIASYAGGTDTFTLVDTATCEHLPVQTSARSELGWNLLDPETTPRDAAFHCRRRDQADEAIALLRERAFDGLTSFRELEHRDLPQALEALPPQLGAVARHLVTENRRVQKLVATLRRNDWQMVGALLFMSHASRHDEWGGTNTPGDCLVEQAESLTVESIYGACMTGRGGYVVLVGLPHAMLIGLQQLTAAFAQRFDHAPEAMML